MRELERALAAGEAHVHGGELVERGRRGVRGQCLLAVRLPVHPRFVPSASVSRYDAIARLYDPWSRSVTEDVGFYVDLAREHRGPVVELGVGTGRIAVPTAIAGVRVIGVDSSPGMLEVCRKRAEAAGVMELLDLRLGDLAAPPVSERVPPVTC